MFPYPKTSYQIFYFLTLNISGTKTKIIFLFLNKQTFIVVNFPSFVCKEKGSLVTITSSDLFTELLLSSFLIFDTEFETFEPLTSKG